MRVGVSSSIEMRFAVVTAAQAAEVTPITAPRICSARSSSKRTKEWDKALASCELFQLLISRLFNYPLALLIGVALCGQVPIAASPPVASTLGPQEKILLVSFRNNTKDGDFDDSLKEALRTALEESPFLNTIPE